MRSLAWICWALAAWSAAVWFGVGIPFLIAGLTVAGGVLWWHDKSAHLPPPKATHTRPGPMRGNKFNYDEGDE